MGTYGIYRAKLKFRTPELADLFVLGQIHKDKKTWGVVGCNDPAEPCWVYLENEYGRMFDFTQQEPSTTDFWDSLTLTENLLLPNIKGLVEEFEIESESFDYIQEDLAYIDYLTEVEKGLTQKQKDYILAEFGFEDDDYVFTDILSEALDNLDLSLWEFLGEFGWDEDWVRGWGYKIEAELAEDDEGEYFATDCYDYEHYINQEVFVKEITKWILTSKELNKMIE